MASFADLTANLKLNISDFSSKLNRASVEARRFSRELGGRTVDALEEVNNQTRKWGLNIKSVSQVVSGILISQAFYGTAQNIRAATNAVWEFSQELENAHIAYSNLFGDSSLSKEFINVLKDYAAETPFAFTDAEKASRRLMAYGIKSENLMYVMQGIMSTATAQGDSTKIEPLSRAIGQIYTYGRLMNAEVRQLTEAGVPAYEILSEKLGLTQSQLKDLGNQAISSTDAINALIDGMSERFGGLTIAASKTITGIVSNIRDNATMLSAGLVAPIVTGIKSVLAYIGTTLFDLRDILETSGIGGVFEKVFPPESHALLRQFAASFLVFTRELARLASSILSYLGPAMQALIMLFNTLGPTISFVASVLSAILDVIRNNAIAMKVLTAALAAAATMWVVFKLKALASAAVAGVIALISKALGGLSIALTAIVAHPFWALLITLVGVVAGLSFGFGRLSDGIRKMYNSLTSIQGVDADKLLLPSQEERANDLDKFNKKLKGTSQAMDDLSDSTSKATKAAKSLLSFDEVFRLNEPDEGTNKGIQPDVDFDLGELGGWGGDITMPEVPDFTGFSENYVAKLIASLKEKLIGAGIGAILGGVLGGLLGGPLGAKIGAIAGALAGWFWSDFADAIGLTDVGKVALPISTMLGAILGFVLGGPVGAVVGAFAGGLVGLLIDAVALAMNKGDWTRISYPLATGLGAAIGFVIGGPGGAVLGAGIGAVVGWIISKIISVFQDADWDFALIVDAFRLWGIDIGNAFIEGLFSDGGLFGWSTELFGFSSDFFSDAWDAFQSGDWAGIGKNILLGILSGLAAAITFIFEPIARVFKGIFDAFCVIFGIHSPAKAMEPIGKNILLGLLEGIVGALGAVLQGIANVCAKILGTVVDVFNNIRGKIASFISDTASKLGSWASNLWSSVSGAVSSVVSTIASGMTSATKTVFKFCADTLSKAISWAKDFSKTVRGAMEDAFDKASNFIVDTKDAVVGGAKKGAKVVKGGAKKVAGAASDAWDFATGWIGHADGGVFNREHVARFSEGDKAEAIIPLDEKTAMQPFVDAVANGLTASLAPILSNVSGSQQLQPLYVGTLIADDRSLKELERKMEVIRVQEGKR